MTRILVVDDEPHIVSLVTRGLHADGYETVSCDDGQAGLDRALMGDIDLLILDVGLPTIDGFEVLRSLRASGERMPVIMLTARSAAHDAVDGLDAGASDYVSKPFSVVELLARVRSRLRESEGAGAAILVHGDVALDIMARRTTMAGHDIELSAREFALAEQFLRHPGAVLTRELLLSRVWGMDFDPKSNVVDVYVRYLRAKLGSAHIVTVRGEGYRWE